MTTTVLDWRELAPPQRMHHCDCEYCDEDGRFEPIVWPTLCRVTAGGTEYVTDRYLMLRADLAPIPEGYEGPVLDPIQRDERNGFMAATVTDQPANGKRFRWQVIKAIEATGLRLRLLADTDACGVVTADGEHVGWAMPLKAITEDPWDALKTPEYQEARS